MTIRLSGKLIRRWLPILIVIAAGVLAITHFGQLKQFGQILRHARPAMLALAALLQLSTYVSIAVCWKLILRADGCAQPLPRLIRLAVAKLFTDQAVPTAGVSGDVLMVDQLIAFGVPKGQAASTLLLFVLGYFASFGLAALAVLALLWFDRHASSGVTAAISAFVALTIAIPGIALLLARKGTDSKLLTRFKSVRHLMELLGEAPKETLTSKRLIAISIALNGLVIVADAATLWVSFRAFNVAAPASSALVALVMSQIAITLAPVPMGLGSFEAASIGTLRMLGIPFEAAVTATFVLRFFTLWLPLVPGLWITRKMMKKRTEHEEPEQAPQPATAKG